MCVRILSLLLAVSLPNVTLALALEAAALLLKTSTELVASVTIVLVVVVGRLQDRVVLCLHVSSAVVGDILVKSIVQVLRV